MSHNADLIIPRLWLGNYEASQDINFIRKNGINVVINCTKDLPFLELQNVYKYRVPVDDNLRREEMYSMTMWLGKILPIMASHYQTGKTILIHCAAGMQRSAIVTLCFLNLYYSDPKKALYQIRTKRPIVFTPHMNFSSSFRMYFGDRTFQAMYGGTSSPHTPPPYSPYKHG
jgi:hypothetical protein